MAFLNVSLLLGGALFAIPVVLHLIMRQKPKHLVFPALRFVKERRQSNTRRLQLRHWLLLALRSGKGRTGVTGRAWQRVVMG